MVVNQLKRILYTASVDLHIINFHLPYLKFLKDSGYEIHVACSGDRDVEYADIVHRIPFRRSPYDIKNVLAYKRLKEIINKEKFVLIHCHTPMCGIITRLAAREARRNGTIVFYTVHGFHFFTGAPLRNWLIYYPVELLFSLFTDVIITINEEDDNRVQQGIFRIKDKYRISGIGINPDRLDLTTDRRSTRERLSIEEDDLVILYIAEFTKRKNHRYLFDRMKGLTRMVPKVKFVFAGGFSSEKEGLHEFSRRENLDKFIVFMGYQNNIGQLISIADIGLSVSLSEGLPIGVAEMMYSGIPVLASRIRGHKELIDDGINGFLFDFDQRNEFESKLLDLCTNSRLRNNIGLAASLKMEDFMVTRTLKEMEKIYQKFL